MQILSTALALAVVLPAALATNPPCVPKFALYDAVADDFLTDIADGSTIDLYDYYVGATDISIEYVPCGAEPESVAFYVNGDKEICEELSPFTIAANDEDDYFEWTDAQLGALALKAVEYSGAGCKWAERNKVTRINFTLLNSYYH